MTVYTVTKVFTDKYGEPQCDELGVYLKSDKAQKCLERNFGKDLNKMLKVKTNPECLVSTWLDQFYAEILVQTHGSVKKPLPTHLVNRRQYRYYIGKTIVK